MTFRSAISKSFCYSTRCRFNLIHINPLPNDSYLGTMLPRHGKTMAAHIFRIGKRRPQTYILQ